MRLRVTFGVIALFVAACGDDDPHITDEASAALNARVAEIRVLAGERRAADVATRLDQLRAEVAALQQAGDISEERAQEVLAAADAVGPLLPLITTTTTTTAPPPPPAPERRVERGDKEEKDDDEKGDGKGRSKDDD